MAGWFKCQECVSFDENKLTRKGKKADYCALFNKFFIGRFFPKIYPRCFEQKKEGGT